MTVDGEMQQDGLRPRTVDIVTTVIAIPLLIAASFGADLRMDAPHRLDGWGCLLIALAALPLAWRRTAPVHAVVASAVAVVIYLVLGFAYGPVELCVVVAMFEVGRRRSLRFSGAILAAIAAAATLAMLSRLFAHAAAPGLVVVLWISWLVIPWLVGALVRMRTMAATRTRNELISIVTARERMRLAREVHDIAGHGFAVIAMQAGVALMSFDDDPDQARLSLDAIQSVSGRGLAELRSMLGTFHPPSGETTRGARLSIPVDPAPQAQFGIAEIEALIGEIRAAGLDVDARIEAITDVTPELGHVAYRVVQESLTNVVKHAQTQRAEAEVTRVGDVIHVRVVDDGPVTAPGFLAGSGITGMGERVIAVGGSLRAAPRRGGGFEVDARIPLFRHRMESSQGGH